jgi:DedD protein
MAARRRGSRVGTFFVLFGILGVLGGTFLAGVWTGHNWPVLWGGARAGNEPTGKRGVAERPKPTEPLPALTFYDELKAPLTAPPPPPVRGKAKPPELTRRETVPETVPPPALAPIETTMARPEPPASAPRVEPVAPAPRAEPPAADDSGSRFTVQVAAYNVRAQADALRATLAAAGHDARVVEAATPGGVRYRVQVGAFATRQAAQEASARLTAERSSATFVTPR